MIVGGLRLATLLAISALGCASGDEPAGQPTTANTGQTTANTGPTTTRVSAVEQRREPARISAYRRTARTLDILFEYSSRQEIRRIRLRRSPRAVAVQLVLTQHTLQDLRVACVKVRVRVPRSVPVRRLGSGATAIPRATPGSELDERLDAACRTAEIVEPNSAVNIPLPSG